MAEEHRDRGLAGAGREGDLAAAGHAHLHRRSVGARVRGQALHLPLARHRRRHPVRRRTAITSAWRTTTCCAWTRRTARPWTAASRCTSRTCPGRSGRCGRRTRRSKDGRYYLYFPAKRADGHLPASASRSAIIPRDRSRRSLRRSPAATRSTRPCSPTTTASITCTSAASGAGSCRSTATTRYDAGQRRAGRRRAGARAARRAAAAADMKQFAEAPREMLIVDESGQPLRAGDHERRFFEAPWMHKYEGRYYLSYSTGNTHLPVLCDRRQSLRAVHLPGQDPDARWSAGPRTIRSVEFDGKWYLFYHDSIAVRRRHPPALGQGHRDCTTTTQGRILTIDPYGG